MTYFAFHLIFTLPLFIFVVWLNKKNPLAISKTSLYGTLTLIFLAVSYTTPWDSYLIKEKVWTYSPGNVLTTFYRIPVEEYFFFIIQTVIGCLFTSYLLQFFNKQEIKTLVLSVKNFLYFLASMIFLAGLFFMTDFSGPYLYLNLIIFWSLPILILQWCLGWKVLKSFYQVLLVATACLTFYFWVADSVAIYQQIWIFPQGTISGFEILNLLPIEEALFFLVTNLMVVQGYILFTQVNISSIQFYGIKKSA